jgi:anti-anti-sigma regulatory factor
MMLLGSSTLPCPSSDLSGPPRLSVALTFDWPSCELWLTGRLDSFSLVALQTQIDQFSAEPFEEMVVHLDELEELDESGLAALSGMRALVEERGARFRIDGVTEPAPVCLRNMSSVRSGS